MQIYSSRKWRVRHCPVAEIAGSVIVAASLSLYEVLNTEIVREFHLEIARQCCDVMIVAREARAGCDGSRDVP